MKNILIIVGLLLSLTGYSQEIVSDSTFRPTKSGRRVLSDVGDGVLNALEKTGNAQIYGTRSFANVSEMKTFLSPRVGVQYWLSEKGKQGYFEYDPADNTSAENRGLVIVTTNGKRLKRIIENGIINAKWLDDESNSDMGLALQKAIDFLGQDGGTIIFPQKGEYLFKTTPKLPPFVAKLLHINGQGAKVTLTASAKRFLDLAKTADNQTFQNYLIENFEIDANGQANGTSSDHVIIGSRINNAFIGRFNASNWTLRNIKAYNIPDYTSGKRAGVLTISPFHNSPDEATQNYVANITLDNVRATGGTGGFQINGFCGGGKSSANIYFKGIQVNNCGHFINDVPTVFYACSNLHVGGFGYGDDVTIRNFTGTNSGDNSIEVNAMMETNIDGAIMSGSQNYLLYFNNFRQPIDVKSQRINVNGVYGNLTYANSRAFSYGSEGSANIRLGHISITNTHITNPNGLRNVNATALNINPNGAGTKECESLTIENLSYSCSGDVNITTNSYPSVIVVKVINNSNVILRNISMNISGNVTVAGGVQYYPRLVEVLGGSYDLTIDGLTVNTSANFPTLWGVFAQGARTGRTNIRGYRVNSTNTNYTSFRVEGTPFSEGNELQVENSDINNTSAGTDLYTSNVDQLNYVQFTRVNRRLGVMTTGSKSSLAVGTTFPSTKAQLDVKSDSKGVLLPRLTNTQIVSIALPDTSLLAYNKTKSKFEYWDGAYWMGSAAVRLASYTYTAGAIAANTEVTQTVTFTGASVGQVAYAVFSTDVSDVQITQVKVISANTVKVTFKNPTASSLTPVGSLNVTLLK